MRRLQSLLEGAGASRAWAEQGAVNDCYTRKIGKVALNHLWTMLTVLTVTACRLMERTLDMADPLMQVLLMV